eukprot:15443889-Alexandrium_andersonii.AAC.1
MLLLAGVRDRNQRCRFNPVLASSRGCMWLHSAIKDGLAQICAQALGLAYGNHCVGIDGRLAHMSHATCHTEPYGSDATAFGGIADAKVAVCWA